MAKAHGPRIRAAMGYAGLSSPKLATELGVSESTVKRWISGDPSLTPGYRLAIAHICGVPPDFIEGGWGVLEPSDIEALLVQQSTLLKEIRDAVAEEKEAARALREEGAAWAARVAASGQALHPEPGLDAESHESTPGTRAKPDSPRG